MCLCVQFGVTLESSGCAGGPGRIKKDMHSFLSDGEGGEICLPLAKRMTYLGAVLSYDGYEEQSLQHRLSIAELQRYRLHKPLQGRHDLSLGGRTRLWRTCIWSTLCHGLSVTGLGYRSLCTLTAKALKHVRAITGNQVHVGGDGNQSSTTCATGVPRGDAAPTTQHVDCKTPGAC